MGTVKAYNIRPRFGGTADIDPRVKLFLLLAIGFVSYFVAGELAGLLLMAGFCLFISLGRGVKWAMQMLAAYVVVAFLTSTLLYVQVPLPSMIMGVFGVTVQKILPIAMVGRWTLQTSHMDDVMVALQRMKMPQSVIIPLLVVFRYIPTIRVEYRMIRDTMRIRGICDTWGKRLLHPVATLEYILIPLLTRCLKVTEELAASGATRGLERDVRRYSLNDVRITMMDIVVMLGAVVFLGSLAWLDKQAAGSTVVWRAWI